MIVQKLTPKSNGKYEVTIDSETYLFDEETVVKYRLVEGKELLNISIQDIQKMDQIEAMIHLASDYAIKYAKSANEVVAYLQKKGVSSYLAKKVVSELQQRKICQDEKLVLLLAASYARDSNGPMLIRLKLKRHLFSDDLIEEALTHLNAEDIELGKSKLLKKSLKQYEKLDDYQKKMKIKACFYRHGYVDFNESL